MIVEVWNNLHIQYPWLQEEKFRCEEKASKWIIFSELALQLKEMASPLKLSSCSHGELIICYFTEGFQYKEILSLLLNCHKISIKKRTFQRILIRVKLKRKNVKTCSADIANVALTEVEGCGSLLGCRSVHERLRSSYRGIVTDRESTRICMKVLTPARLWLMELARCSYCNKETNHLWHIDGNDKLKPSSLCIQEQLINLVEKSCDWMSVHQTKTQLLSISIC